MNTLIVNLLAGAGCGKSTMASRVFSELKDKGINCELVSEYAKDLVWEERTATFSNELYIYAKQQQRLHRVNGKVDVVITDAPLLLKLMYMSKDLDFTQLVLDVDKKYNNMNFVLNRVKPYNPIGRNQTEDEAKEYDKKIEKLLNKYNIPYYKVNGDKEGSDIVIDKVINYLKGEEENICNHKYSDGKSAIEYDSIYEMRSSDMHCEICKKHGTRQELEEINKELKEITYHE